MGRGRGKEVVSDIVVSVDCFGSVTLRGDGRKVPEVEEEESLSGV
jgi:hypothetical protein